MSVRFDPKKFDPAKKAGRKVAIHDRTSEFAGGAIQFIGGMRPRRVEQPPTDWKFHLEFERGESIYDPSEEQIASGIRSLRVVEGDSYCILSRRDGNYVQAMCGVNGFHVEWRVFHDGDWNKYEHFKAGYPETTETKERCEKAVYGVPGFANELLGRNDAVSIFLAFVRCGEKPEQFVWRQMSDEEMYG